MFKKLIPLGVVAVLVTAWAAPAAFAAPPSRPGSKTATRASAATAKPAAKTTAKPAAAPAQPAQQVAVPAAPAQAVPKMPPKGWRTDKAAWEGFFFDFNVGYSSVSGEDGVKIPDAKSPNTTILLNAMRTTFPTRYAKAISTSGGSGLAAGFTIGYNIKGYVSLAADLAWQGSFTGGKTDMSGIGSGSLLLGVHPLRFWRKDLDFDLKLYGGYGIYEISYYYENQTQTEAKGKSWIGTSIPTGATFYYRIPGSAFVVGADFRYTMASYTAWMYNWDKDIKSEPSPAVTTSRVAGRLILGGHF